MPARVEQVVLDRLLGRFTRGGRCHGRIFFESVDGFLVKVAAPGCCGVVPNRGGGNIYLAYSGRPVFT